jgi:hypothetical protein
MVFSVTFPPFNSCGEVAITPYMMSCFCHLKAPYYRGFANKPCLMIGGYSNFISTFPRSTHLEVKHASEERLEEELQRVSSPASSSYGRYWRLDAP